MNTAIIVAAGSGKRFASETPKQFLDLAGKPVIIHTLERFEACPEIHQVILVLAVSEIEAFETIAPNYSLTKVSCIIPGGKTRAESVFNGLQAVDQRTEIIAVHDGARPLVAVDEISAIVLKAKETGAACLVAPVTDTIKQISGNEITATLDRKNLRRALTPQAFRYEILQKAFANADLGDEVTDECFLVEKLGRTITFIEGSSKNVKITHAEDMIAVEAFMKSSEFKF
ncbi:MAG: 2-C-methyl-D-erythritol 4-phosphate cytidylyltransferase [Saprospiraceae bacterium]|nr:2-C-methyl-D-erythritol 4-phosphate cytidylyltransferase [Pyrinomonadaceae bacterium]